MDKCQRCESERLMQFSAKCSDMFTMQVGDGKMEHGYVPSGPVGGGDYVEGTLCLDCGQWQGEFPAPTPERE